MPDGASKCACSAHIYYCVLVPYLFKPGYYLTAVVVVVLHGSVYDLQGEFSSLPCRQQSGLRDGFWSNAQNVGIKKTIHRLSHRWRRFKFVYFTMMKSWPELLYVYNVWKNNPSQSGENLLFFSRVFPNFTVHYFRFSPLTFSFWVSLF